MRESLSEHRHLIPMSPHPCDPLPIEDAVAELGELAGELRAMLVEHQPGEDKAVPYVEGIIAWVGELEGLAPRRTGAVPAVPKSCEEQPGGWRRRELGRGKRTR